MRDYIKRARIKKDLLKDYKCLKSRQRLTSAHSSQNLLLNAGTQVLYLQLVNRIQTQPQKIPLSVYIMIQKPNKELQYAKDQNMIKSLKRAILLFLREQQKTKMVRVESEKIQSKELIGCISNGSRRRIRYRLKEKKCLKRKRNFISLHWLLNTRNMEILQVKVQQV